MIFNFRIVSDEVDNFKREIKIDADATFLDLKNAICRRLFIACLDHTDISVLKSKES